MTVSIRWRTIASFLGALALLVVYNEWLAYYVVLLQCQWPLMDVETADYSVPAATSAETLRTIVLADTHLLGSREGHWFDRLRRFVKF